MTEAAKLFYDIKSDVLYLTVGKPRPAVRREVGEDVLLRLDDPDTGEVIGLTVLNLSARFGSLKDPQVLPVEINLRVITEV